MNPMKHRGKARKAGLRIIFWTLILVIAIFGGGVVAVLVGSAVAATSTILISLWVIFALFALYFFRDPNASDPQSTHAIVSPAHGTVDAIDQIEEFEFMGGPCQRVSVFLSIFDVHVQKSPVSGRVVYMKHHLGEFLNAMRLEAAAHNENVLIGFVTNGDPEYKVGVRLIAGLLARRIVPWIAQGDSVARGERISLIQFGSRCDLYMPLSVKVQVKMGQKVIGGQTIMALRE